MLKIHPNIIVGTPYDLSLVLDKVNYIFNCSPNLNNLIVHQNYINLTLVNFSYETLQLLLYLYNFIIDKIAYNQNIFILCETGINSSLTVGMFLIMKLYKLNFDYVYHNIAHSHKIGSYELYSGLKHFELFIDDNSGEKMDIC
jgi:hypothetical protein